jgi:hypothetical protein
MEADWSIWDLACADHYRVEEDAAAESAAVFVVVEAAVAEAGVVVGAVVEAATPIHSKGCFLAAHQSQTPTGSYVNQKKSTRFASEKPRKVTSIFDHPPLARYQV